MMSNLLNFLAMQVSWFACVLGAANELPWLGVGVSLTVVTIHLFRARQPRVEIKLVLCALAMGLVLDSALASGGLITFTSGTLIDGVAPPWMLGLWIGFATTLNTSLNWLMNRPVIAVVFGALGGPAAYGSGATLGALTLNNIDVSLLCIGVGWGVVMGLFAILARKPSTAVRTAEIHA